MDLCELCVPKNWRSELEDVTDILSEGCRLDPFSPRHIRHFGESKLLDFVGELLAFGFIARAHPVGDELVELRNFWPAEAFGPAPDMPKWTAGLMTSAPATTYEAGSSRPFPAAPCVLARPDSSTNP